MRPVVGPRTARLLLKVVYGLFVAGLVAYLVTLLVRSPAQQWPWLDGWAVAGFEVAASLACLARGLSPRPGRGVALALGTGLLSWSIGDILLTVESSGGSTPSIPSPADGFYLASYPLIYLALVLLLRRQASTIAPRSWLDGAIAGLGAAAVCAAFAFHSILTSAGGTPLSVVTDLAYPIGDALLLALAIGGSAIVPVKSRISWLLVAGGIALNVVGDAVNVFQSSAAASPTGTVINAIAWPTSIVLMSVAVWVVPRRSDLVAPQQAPGFALPGLASAAGVVILVVGGLHSLSRVALLLATLTLGMVGVRLVMTVRSLRTITIERHRQSVTDELTQLGNRRLLFGVLDAFFAEGPGRRTADGRGERTLAFLFIDLDRFKEVNDSFGHPAGDELLRQLGPRLQESVGQAGFAVRFGGDEFAAVLMDVDRDAALAVARRLTANLTAPYLLSGIKAVVGTSVGVALAPTDASDSAGLVWCADAAMYRAKLGNEPIALYDRLLDHGEDQLRLAADLRSAVEAGDFVVHYQAQLDLRTGQVKAVEALLRWHHPELGLIPPLKFLPLAEESGLMRKITSWVLDAAVRQTASWIAAGRDLSVSVNISATDLLDPDLHDLVAEVLERYHVPAKVLVLEVTETSIISDFQQSKLMIDRLRDLGVVVSIDDFGAGFTSLAHLSGLAVGELKLDRAFITGLARTTKVRDLELVRATIELGHAMGLRVVAEGIEDDATLKLLSEYGCDLAQGYFIGRPMPADKLHFRATIKDEVLPGEVLPGEVCAAALSRPTAADTAY